MKESNVIDSVVEKTASEIQQMVSDRLRSISGAMTDLVGKPSLSVDDVSILNKLRDDIQQLRNDAIVMYHATGTTQTTLCSAFGLSPARISQIIKNSKKEVKNEI